MVLTGNTLRWRSVDQNEVIITPWHERTDFLGKTFGVSFAGYDVRVKQASILAPGEFWLASTIEHFSIPLDLVAIVHDKSSWARKGLAVQNTVFEPGWRGYATLELSNHSAEPVRILAGDPIAQVIFHRLNEELGANQGYNGKYQDQADRPVYAK